MSSDTTQPVDDQNLWRAVFTSEKGWSPGVGFADHLSIAAPALAEVDGTLYCVHRGARDGEEKQQPINWTSFTPATLKPYVTALEEARTPLPEDATEEQVAQWQKNVQAAADALAAARRWTPDARVGWIRSTEAPALVNDGGTLRMVFTNAEPDYDTTYLSLAEVELKRDGDKVRWGQPVAIEADRMSGSASFAPALAVFNGQVHLLYAVPDEGCIVHLVRHDAGDWQPVAAADGTEVATPALRQTPPQWVMEHLKKDGYVGNLALAVHDGKLHLVYRDYALSPRLVHAVFDGTTWTKAEPVGQSSRRTAALASYDGKLHAV
ncbi:hypothetical protein ABZW32_39950, partial [Streptomyces sp. NPDC004667]|uniref:hypothetical protein n=1 Tax=Streptomyces sp. NPDC004667 TaxID=3154285 RepID=UPI0033B23168